MRAIFNILFLLFIASILIVSIIGIPFVLLYCFLVFFGGGSRRQKIISKVSSTLMDGEKIGASAHEYRAMALFHRRRSIFLTDSRVIFIKRKIFGGFQMIDRKWKELQDAKMSENILPALSGASLSFSFVSPPGGAMQLSGAAAEDASIIYKYAQYQEQAWEEKRRVRGLEEKRAASGGINIGFPQQSATPQPALISGTTIDLTPSNVVVDELNRAKSLLDSGAISDTEFQEIKSKILSRHF